MEFKTLTTRYTINPVSCLNELLALPNETRMFLAIVANKMAVVDNRFTWRDFNFHHYFNSGGRLMICYRDELPVGLMLARLTTSIWQPSIKIYQQDLLFGENGTRAVKYLLDDFIDFGRSNADHLVSIIDRGTNIKGRSLEKLGFKKDAMFYAIEV